MEYILYVLIVVAGAEGPRIDSERYESKMACEKAASIVDQTILDQVEGLRGDVDLFSIQFRCIPAGDLEAEETE